MSLCQSRPLRQTPVFHPFPSARTNPSSWEDSKQPAQIASQSIQLVQAPETSSIPSVFSNLQLPWEDRLLHKNWKVRNDANIDLASLCDSITGPKVSRFRDFGPLFRKTVADSNAPLQEKALDALIAFLRAADADVRGYAKETCDAIVAKCLTGRPKTVEKS